MSQQNFNEKIAEKAYEIYQSRGCGHGNDLDDWLQAEKEITASKNSASKIEPPSKTKIYQNSRRKR